MILCCGEALIDMIATPTISGEAGFVPHSGGAIFNTAIALGRLGSPVGLLTVCLRICSESNWPMRCKPATWMQAT